MLGINLSGAEFGNIGGQYGWSYIYPSAGDLDYYVKHGVQLVRLPVRWERLQPTIGGALDPAEVGRLNKFLDDAKAANVKVIVDVHNFGAYNGANLGTAGATTAQFADFWKKLAGAVGTQPALTGYDLMNEPHDLPPGVWPAAAQAAVDAIRTVDTAHSIYVEGEAWSSSINWSQTNAGLDIKDPANKIVYEAHIYFDRYTSGTYQGSYDSEGAYPEIGADRIADFVKWLADKNAKGFIGEFAVPNNDPRWLTVLDKFAAAMDAANLDGTYWGAGPWWGDYPLALRTGAGDPNPQLSVIEKYFKSAPVPDVQPVAPVIAAVDFGPDILVGLDGAGGAITSVAPATPAPATTTGADSGTATAAITTTTTTTTTSDRGASRIDGYEDLVRNGSDAVIARTLKTAAPVSTTVDPQVATATKAAPLVVSTAAAPTVAATTVVATTSDVASFAPVQTAAPVVSVVSKVADVAAPVVSVVSKVADIAAPVVSVASTKVADATASAQVSTLVSTVSDAVVKTSVSSTLSKAAAKAAAATAKAAAAAAAAQLKFAATHAVLTDAAASVEHLATSASVKAVATTMEPAVVTSAAVAVTPAAAKAFVLSPLADTPMSILGDGDDHGLGGLVTIAHHATSAHMFDFMM